MNDMRARLLACVLLPDALLLGTSQNPDSDEFEYEPIVAYESALIQD